MPLADAAGLVLAADVIAAEQVPPFANTAMDGFAVRAGDVASVPVTLEVVGTVAAGSTLDSEVGPGQAARIMTGAPMPNGADAVVMPAATVPATVTSVALAIAFSALAALPTIATLLFVKSIF